MSYILQILTSKMETKALLQLYLLSKGKYSTILREVETRLKRKLYSLQQDFEHLDTSLFLQCRKGEEPLSKKVTYLHVHTDTTYLRLKVQRVEGVYHIIIQQMMTKRHCDFDTTLRVVSQMFVEFHLHPVSIYKSATCKTTMYHGQGQVTMFGKKYSANYSARRLYGVNRISLLEDSVKQIE